jgi:hypothetical protein
LIDKKTKGGKRMSIVESLKRRMAELFIAFVIVVIVAFVFCLLFSSDVMDMDLSEINAEKIIIGSNPWQKAQEVSPEEFLSGQYETVLLGFDDEEMVYLGETKDRKWFCSKQRVFFSNQYVVISASIYIENRLLVHTSGRDWGKITLLITIMVLFLGLFALVWSCEEEESREKRKKRMST